MKLLDQFTLLKSLSFFYFIFFSMLFKILFFLRSFWMTLNIKWGKWFISSYLESLHKELLTCFTFGLWNKYKKSSLFPDTLIQGMYPDTLIQGMYPDTLRQECFFYLPIDLSFTLFPEIGWNSNVWTQNSFFFRIWQISVQKCCTHVQIFLTSVLILSQSWVEN